MLGTVFEAAKEGLETELLPRTVDATLQESNRQSFQLKRPLVFEHVLPQPNNLVSHKI